MRTIRTLQMAVESPADGIRVIRTAGTIDRQAAAGLLRLVDAQIAQVAAGRTSTTHLIIDLANVDRFEPGGMETLHQHRSAGRCREVGLHLTGGGGRLSLLPLRVRQLLGDFSTFPTTEIAIADLTGQPSPAESGRPGLDEVHVIEQTVHDRSRRMATRCGPGSVKPAGRDRSAESSRGARH